MQESSFKQQFIGLLFTAIALFGNLSVFAQTKRGASAPSKTQVASSQTKSETKACNTGYSGSVNYTKVLAITSTGRFGSYTLTKRTYQTTVLVRDGGTLNGSASMSPDGGVVGSFNLKGSAEASENELNDQLNNSEGETSCDLLGKNKKYRKCTSHWTRKTDASGSSEANVYIALRGRTMHLGISGLPKINGTMTETSKGSCSGTCTPDKPINSSRSVEVKDVGEKWAHTDEETIAFNPQSFNRLSGSWSKVSPTPGGTVTETFQWNLSRCAPPLEIANITFEHKKVPNPDKWVGIDPLNGTVDGNTVKIKARVFNNGGDTAYANVKFSELKSGADLPDAKTSVAVKPGEYRDVEYEWDTSGYAWDENRKNQSEREILATLEGGNTEKAKIKILPKPVVMVHGLWSNAGAWAEYPTYLREAHSFAWQGFAVGADPEHGKMNTGNEPGNYRPTNTIYENARELEKQIKYTRESLNAWHIDIVAHSMGGLISRQYINSFMGYEWDMRPTVTHLVMLGTPNQGSPCADIVNHVFEENGHNNMEAMRELKPIIVRAFNARITDRKKVLFSIMAGTPLPFTCHEKVQGDLVVPIQSALYTIPDRRYTTSDHLSMTGKDDFLGFVLPRLAIGPKKAQQERYMYENFSAGNEVYQREIEPKADRYGFNKYFQNVSYKRAEKIEAVEEEEEDDSLKNLTAKRKIELAANQTTEIEIPVNDADYAGVVLVATPAVTATLTDASGATVGKSAGGMEAVKQMFRTIVVDKKVTSGIWKLKLENLGNQPTTVFAAGFAGSNNGGTADFTIEAGKPSAAGTISLVAKLTENNAPVLSAKITAKIVGDDAEIAFYDDGKHGDGAANDGVYGAATGKLAKGEYFVEAKAEVDKLTKMAITQINVGATMPTKAATNKRGGK